jgi:hypothetical protein
MVDQKYLVRYNWKAGDLGFWDNRATMQRHRRKPLTFAYHQSQPRDLNVAHPDASILNSSARLTVRRSRVGKKFITMSDLRCQIERNT